MVLAGATVLSGCLGASSREEFEEMVRERGGGVSAASLDVVLDDLRERVGTDDPSIRFGRIDFAATTMVFEVRNPGRPAELDTYAYRNEGFVSAEPVRLTATDDLDAATAPLSTFSLDIEAMTSRALTEFDSSGGYATSVTMLGFIAPFRIQVDVESPRATGTAVFDQHGEFLEFRR